MSRTINRTYIYYKLCCDWYKPITVDAYLLTDRDVLFFFLNTFRRNLQEISHYLTHQYIIHDHIINISYHSWSFITCTLSLVITMPNMPTWTSASLCGEPVLPALSLSPAHTHTRTQTERYSCVVPKAMTTKCHSKAFRY